MYIQYTLAILVNIKIRQLKASVFFFLLLASNPARFLVIPGLL